MKVTFSSDMGLYPYCMVSFVWRKENFVKVLEPGKLQEIQIGVGEFDKEKNAEEQKLSLVDLGLKIREIVQIAKKHKLKEFSIDFVSLWNVCGRYAVSRILETIITNLLMADYEFRTYKKEPKGGWNNIERVVIFYNKKAGGLSSAGIKINLAIEKGIKIGEAINRCREICNLPSNALTPGSFAGKARNIFGGNAHILDEHQMTSLNMNGILSVGKGSASKSYMLVLRHMDAPNKSDKPIILVGKGVTFDSGGISLKSTAGLDDMHKDMSGAAAVFQTVALARDTGLNLNIIGIIPLVENMPSGSALKPNDIIRMMNGKTVEIKSTDAEGRLILADALTYACRNCGNTPEAVIDVATLTGAACVALGEHKSAIFTNDIKLRDFLWNLGDEIGDPVWPLPFGDAYKREIKSKVADLRNIGTSKLGGAQHGAVFLQQFVDDGIPWVHIDIAPRMNAQSYENLAHGASGAPMLLLIKYLESLCK